MGAAREPGLRGQDRRVREEEKTGKRWLIFKKSFLVLRTRSRSKTKLGIKFESTIFCSLTCLDERKMFCLYLFFI